MTELPSPPIGFRRRFAAILGWTTAVLALGAAAWILVLLSAELGFRRLPPLTEAPIAPRALAGYRLELERLLARDPGNGEIRNAYASALGREGEHARAIEELQRAMVVQNVQNSRFFLADMYSRMGRTEDAEREMAACVIINPTNPEFHPAWQRLLLNRVFALQELQETNKPYDPKALAEARHQFGAATLDWAVRAPHDRNSYLFLGNFYVSHLRGPVERHYLLQAYRCYLLALSQAPWMNLNRTMMIQPRDALATVRQILDGHFARPYKGLP